MGASATVHRRPLQRAVPRRRTLHGCVAACCNTLQHVALWQLMDETMDFGYPQSTEAKILQASTLSTTSTRSSPEAAMTDGCSGLPRGQPAAATHNAWSCEQYAFARVDNATCNAAHARCDVETGGINRQATLPRAAQRAQPQSAHRASGTRPSRMGCNGPHAAKRAACIAAYAGVHHARESQDGGGATTAAGGHVGCVMEV